MELSLRVKMLGDACAGRIRFLEFDDRLVDSRSVDAEPIERWDPRIRRYMMPGLEGAIRLACSALARVETPLLITLIEDPEDQLRAAVSRPRTSQLSWIVPTTMLGLISQRARFEGPGFHLGQPGRNASGVLATIAALSLSRTVVFVAAKPLQCRAACAVLGEGGRLIQVRPEPSFELVAMLIAWVDRLHEDGGTRNDE